MTGRELIIADQMPVIVHQASVTKKLERLLELIGKPMPTNIYTFMIKLRTKNNKKLAKQDNKRIYFQYIHSESILEKNITQWIKIFCCIK